MVKEFQSGKHTVLVQGNKPILIHTHPNQEAAKSWEGEHLGRRIVAVSLLCPQLKLREDHHWTRKDMSPAGQDLSKVIEQVMGGLGSEVPLTLTLPLLVRIYVASNTSFLLQIMSCSFGKVISCFTKQNRKPGCVCGWNVE